MLALRRAYGAGPLHLLAALATFAVAAYALSRVFELLSEPSGFLVWFGGAIVAHDLLLLPLYSLAGIVSARAVLGAAPPSRLRVAILNHLRIPLLLSGVLLLAWYPLVLGIPDRTFRRASGLSVDVYLGRWLLLSAALMGGSLALLLLRLPRLRRREGP